MKTQGELVGWRKREGSSHHRRFFELSFSRRSHRDLGRVLHDKTTCNVQRQNCPIPTCPPIPNTENRPLHQLCCPQLSPKCCYSTMTTNRRLRNKHPWGFPRIDTSRPCHPFTVNNFFFFLFPSTLLYSARCQKKKGLTNDKTSQAVGWLTDRCYHFLTYFFPLNSRVRSFPSSWTFLDVQE